MVRGKERHDKRTKKWRPLYCRQQRDRLDLSALSEEWSEIAKSFDVATGSFEIGSLLELEGRWQALEKIRILMGAEVTRRTRKAVSRGRQSQGRQRALDKSLEADKDANPFLNGVPAVVEALQSRQIECRVYDRDKFHAKAYITHAKVDVVGAQALVGSSNFTRPGLTENIELNIQVQSAREVAQLQEWFDQHWGEAKDVTDDVLKTLSRGTRTPTPHSTSTPRPSMSSFAGMR